MMIDPLMIHKFDVWQMQIFKPRVVPSLFYYHFTLFQQAHPSHIASPTSPITLPTFHITQASSCHFQRGASS